MAKFRIVDLPPGGKSKKNVVRPVQIHGVLNSVFQRLPQNLNWLGWRFQLELCRWPKNNFGMVRTGINFAF
jgi:hypothetical protein